MFGLEILRINFAFLALIGGAVGVLALFLTYWMIWSPRTDPGTEEHAPSSWQALRQIPWIIYLTLVAVIAWGLYYLLLCARHPPNW